MRSRRPRTRFRIRRWHARGGLIAAALILLLAVTGLLLNHAEDLELDQHKVNAAWVYRLYGDQTGATGVAFEAGGQIVMQQGDGSLFLDGIAIPPCAGMLRGTVALTRYLIVGCEYELLLLEGTERIDAIGTASGLDAAVTGLGSIEGDPAGVGVQFQSGWQRLDVDSMGLAPAVESARFIPRQPLTMAATSAGESRWLSWERLLLDLHSGRLLGRHGPWLMDLGGLLAILLALSGTFTWLAERRRS